MSEHEELVKALNILDQRGWSSQGWGVVEVCALHALHIVHFGEKEFRPGCIQITLEAESTRQLARAIGTDCGHIGLWNDSADTTEAMVREAFRKAIAATAPEPEDVPLGEVVEEVVVSGTS